MLPTSPASPGRWTTATTSWSRWTPTAVSSRTVAAVARCAAQRGSGPGFALGTRWVGGELAEVARNPCPKGQLVPRRALRIPLQDATGGYRAFRASTLRALDLDGVAGARYIFQVDLAYRTLAKGYARGRVPIEFVEREVGDSKMNHKIVSEALWR